MLSPEAALRIYLCLSLSASLPVCLSLFLCLSLPLFISFCCSLPLSSVCVLPWLCLCMCWCNNPHMCTWKAESDLGYFPSSFFTLCFSLFEPGTHRLSCTGWLWSPAPRICLPLASSSGIIETNDHSWFYTWGLGLRTQVLRHSKHSCCWAMTSALDGFFPLTSD